MNFFIIYSNCCDKNLWYSGNNIFII